MKRVVCTWLFLVVLGVLAHADDWPAWRGPAGTGVTPEKGLPEQWSDSSGIAWRTKLPGTGVSTPVVAGPHLFVTAQIGTGTRRSGNHPSLVQGAGGATSGERNLRNPSNAGSGGVKFAITAYKWSDGTRAWHHETNAEDPLI